VTGDDKVGDPTLNACSNTHGEICLLQTIIDATNGATKGLPCNYAKVSYMNHKYLHSGLQLVVLEGPSVSTAAERPFPRTKFNAGNDFLVKEKFENCQSSFRRNQLLPSVEFDCVWTRTLGLIEDE